MTKKQIKFFFFSEKKRDQLRARDDDSEAFKFRATQLDDNNE